MNWKRFDQLGSYLALDSDGKVWICPMLANGEMEDEEYAGPAEGFFHPELIKELKGER